VMHVMSMHRYSYNILGTNTQVKCYLLTNQTTHYTQNLPSSFLIYCITLLCKKMSTQLQCR